MTPALLFPLGLAALAAILLPLVIHLARRTEQSPTDFAALRWLRQKPRPRHRPKFDEIVLLLVRALLLALLALFVARPVLRGDGDRTRVVAVVPGTVVPPEDGVRRVWLAAGFPSIETPRPSGTLPIGSLIRQLDAELPRGAPLTVVVPERLDGADAQVPRVSRAIDWRVTPGAMTTARTPPPPPRFALRGPAQAPGDRYVRAAAVALGDAAIDSGDVTRAVPARTRAAVWLAPGALPDAIMTWTDRGGTLLTARDTVIPAGPTTAAWLDEAGAPLVERQPQGRGQILRFTRALTPAALPLLLDPRFPTVLAGLLGGDAPAPARILASAYRPVAGGFAPPPPSRDLQPWVALVIAALWLIERWLATRSRRAVAP